MFRLFANFILSLCCYLAIGCASQRPVIPVGQVPQVAPASQDEVQSCLAMIQEYSKKFPHTGNPVYMQRAKNVVEKLTSFRKDLNDEMWTVAVLESGDMANALATTGNCVVIFTGLMKKVSDLELSVVVSHEIGHVLGRHPQPDLAEVFNSVLSQGVGVAVGEAVMGGSKSASAGGGDVVGNLVTAALQGLLVNPDSQRLEYEADQIGLFLMADAGLDPSAALSFWQKANTVLGSAHPIEFLSTHPSHNNRLNRLKEILPKATERYRAALNRNRR